MNDIIYCLSYITKIINSIDVGDYIMLTNYLVSFFNYSDMSLQLFYKPSCLIYLTITQVFIDSLISEGYLPNSLQLLSI